MGATCCTRRDCEKWLGHRVQAIFGAFRLLLGGGTAVQLPLAKYEIYLTFSKSASVWKFIIWLFPHAGLNVPIEHSGFFLSVYYLSISSAKFDKASISLSLTVVLIVTVFSIKSIFFICSNSAFIAFTALGAHDAFSTSATFLFW